MVTVTCKEEEGIREKLPLRMAGLEGGARVNSLSARYHPTALLLVYVIPKDAEHGAEQPG